MRCQGTRRVALADPPTGPGVGEGDDGGGARVTSAVGGGGAGASGGGKGPAESCGGEGAGAVSGAGDGKATSTGIANSADKKYVGRPTLSTVFDNNNHGVCHQGLEEGGFLQTSHFQTPTRVGVWPKRPWC